MTSVETERGTPRRVTRKADSSSAPKRLRSPVDQQRAEFLRRCRARIDPAELGLPRSRIRRTEGLRREDVASLSGVSACWYAWLEQGRDMRVSDDVLERLSHTLRLSEDERVYLFSLVQHRAPRVRDDTHEEAPADVVRLLNALSVPAIAMNLRWDVLAWNRLNSKIYRDYGSLPLEDRNLLEILLANPVRHLDPKALESTARKLVARLRFDYSKHADDPRFEALIGRLSNRSPLFRRLWRMPEFTLRPFGIHRFTHPKWGELAFEHTSCTPDGYPHIRIVICTPENAAAHAAIARIGGDVPRPAT
ncbi:MAG: helix-turn-helix transcriptional regulator [Gammaproteobacteria bacterium]